jgi:hypothetical protein
MLKLRISGGAQDDVVVGAGMGGVVVGAEYRRSDSDDVVEEIERGWAGMPLVSARADCVPL